MKKIKFVFFFLLTMSIIACDKNDAEPTPIENEPVTNEPVTNVGGKLDVYPSPGELSSVEHLSKSEDYIVEVRRKGETEYKPCFVYKADNYWVDKYFGSAPRPETTAQFTSFAFSGTSVEVKITFTSGVNTVAVRPLNFGINPVKNGNVVTFTVSQPRKLSVEINNRKNPLFIFAEAPDVPNIAATYYYGPGVHNIGLLKMLQSNESVYIAAGAVVEGSFRMAYNSTNISIKGRGILTMGQWEHESTEVPWLGDHTTIRANATNFLQMEGLILANSTGWMIPIYNSGNLTHDNQFRNLKQIGFNGNTDGIWVNGNNHIIDDCFIFNNDDIFMSHGATNCKISNIVAWGGVWGRLYWLSNQASTSKITFENINLIGKQGGPMLISVDGETGTKLTMSDITFRNVRIESHPKFNSYSTNKFIALNSGYKAVTNWLFENVTIDDKNPDEGDFYGTANSPIDGIKFKNLRIGGTKVMSLSDGNMDKNSFATNITFE